MKWKRLDYSDFKLYLAEDELQTLNTYSTDLEHIVNDELDVISDAFRGAFKAKGYVIDIRDFYTPNTYKHFILAYARWSVWARFPMANNYALSEPRKIEYETAKEMLKNPFLGVPAPDYADDPDLSGRTEELNKITDASLTLPWQRIPAKPWCFGFSRPYIQDTQYSK